MKYFKTIFHISAPEALLQDARDIAAALAGEAGYESFEDTDEGLCGYVQRSLFDAKQLDLMMANFPLPGVEISCENTEAEDRDWNEQWEQQGFDPIAIGNGIVIHDGRHMPRQAAIAIEIDAKMAFGTGNHQTTRMIVAELAAMDLNGKLVLDCGTGTGILSIVALKLGAAHAVGYDIDEWSADNARHNAVINGVDTRFTSLLGDASILATLNQKFDLVVANINRNILLNDMPRFAERMKSGSRLILSGFYEEDADRLLAEAERLGLKFIKQTNEDNWDCLVFEAGF